MCAATLVEAAEWAPRDGNDRERAGWADGALAGAHSPAELGQLAIGPKLAPDPIAQPGLGEHERDRGPRHAAGQRHHIAAPGAIPARALEVDAACLCDVHSTHMFLLG
jgi:hypothetical protein